MAGWRDMARENMERKWSKQDEILIANCRVTLYENTFAANFHKHLSCYYFMLVGNKVIV